MLLFRSPTTSAAEQAAYYQQDYRQGFTTDLPDEMTLRKYLDSGFRGTEKDYSPYLGVLEALGGNKGLSLFDLGCSWGYGSWQLKRHGLAVESFEVSTRRGEFARNKLGLRVHSALSQVTGSFDFFFSAHVLEHLPSVAETIEFGFRVLKPGGLFIAFTPNGSDALRIRQPEAWHRLWGQVHPNFLDDVYYRKAFAGKSFVLGSKPYDLARLADWSASGQGQIFLDLGGDELLVAARKPL